MSKLSLIEFLISALRALIGIFRVNKSDIVLTIMKILEYKKIHNFCHNLSHDDL